MKRSKIFLGATTALLAIAGVAAAKFTTNTRQAYYVTFNKTWCVGVNVPCTQFGNQDCQYLTAAPIGNSVQTFTLGPAGTYNKTTPVNCIHNVKYNGIQ